MSNAESPLMKAYAAGMLSPNMQAYAEHMKANYHRGPEGNFIFQGGGRLYVVVISRLPNLHLTYEIVQGKHHLTT